MICTGLAACAYKLIMNQKSSLFSWVIYGCRTMVSTGVTAFSVGEHDPVCVGSEILFGFLVD